MSSGRWLIRILVGLVIAAGAAGAVLAYTGVHTPARAPLVLLFLVVAPALAVASTLSGFDSLARVVVAGTAAIVIDALIAEVMIASGAWSLRTGIVAVALASAMIVVARALLARSKPSVAAGQGAAARPGQR
jgi:hypothetical protein